ncbi:flagella assembly protein FlgT middle domain-containing protein [Zoogloea sp.]|uniref:flagella assembly protein FlgT middle domain-containing protein n=1 Tax=Zoogloea sp. TaxID=49181 RepID=UPI0031FC2766
MDARSGTASHQTAFDQVVIRSGTRVERHRILAETEQDGVYRVRLSAELGAAGGHRGPVCREGHTRRLLLLGFPVQRPEQLAMREMTGYAQLTATEAARRFPEDAAILVDHQGDLMVLPGVPERVVDGVAADLQGWSVIRDAARRHRAQYVLAGRFRSLALAADEKSREVDLEALILDASSGVCVARQRFRRVAQGKVKIPGTVVFGSADHYATDFGKAYAAVLDDMARWAEATTSCLPFSARVIRSGKDAVHLDAGAEQGLAPGDLLSAFRPDRQPVVTPGGEILGLEKRPLGEVVITTVYPRFAIARLQTPAPDLQLEAGDELHGH